MTLIRSISGIRGTIGGQAGSGLTPSDIVKYVSAYCEWLKEATGKERPKVVVGRDGRISGEMVSQIAVGTLCGCGADVIDAGLSTTPTVEMAVIHHAAQGGIIFTASHNPRQWNALKLLNDKGEFLSALDGQRVLDIAEAGELLFAEVDDLGSITTDPTAIDRHITAILNHPLVDANAIRSAGFRIACDCVNSTGGISVPLLLHQLGVKEIHEMFCEVSGEFPHNPEPLPEHLGSLSEWVRTRQLDLGIAVDPDVDRLALVCEDGSMFGEEYTLVAVADYVLSLRPGNTVSNLSSSRALRDVTLQRGGHYQASAVGEVNVVEAMKASQAVIGGEGNGGVIVPELHYGRDALAGIALFLTHLAKSGKKASALRDSYPRYEIVKLKLDLPPGQDVSELLRTLESRFSGEEVSTIDGVKVDFEEGWVHLRASNTEPIIRVYAESHSREDAEALAGSVMKIAKELIAK